MVRKRGGHSGVDYDKVDSRLPCQDVYRCASRKEVLHHLYRNFLGIAGDALGNNAVIACGYDDCLALQSRTIGTEYACQLY